MLLTEGLSSRPLFLPFPKEVEQASPRKSELCVDLASHYAMVAGGHPA